MTVLLRPAAAAASLAVAAGLLTAATTGGATASDAPTRASAATAASSKVDVFITRDRTVRMPRTLRPGVHRFKVSSARRAGLQLFTTRAGYSKREVARDLNRGLGEGNVRAFRRFERNVRLLGGMPSTRRESAVLWARLPRGKVHAIDVNLMPLTASAVRTVRVKGRVVAGTLPGSKAVRAVGENRFAGKPRVIPKRGELTFRNNSDGNHFLIMAKLRRGMTIEDFEAWLEGGAQGPPPVREDVGLDTNVVSPGKAFSFRYRLPRGNYVMTCFWPDADMDLMPHAFMGMYRSIRVR